ncbi:MAG: hypothetical protein IJV80_02540 [Clostridia bacterium]|nr:hypothetical protein [Clostridia bacterium]
MNEFLKNAQENTKDGRIPLGVSAQGETVYAHLSANAERYRHVCVSGKERTAFLQWFIRGVFQKYPARGALVIVLSPLSSYGAFLREKNADIIVPYLSSIQEFSRVLEGFSPLIETLKKGNKRPVFFVVDGLELLAGASEDKLLKNYTAVIEKTAGTEIEVLTGVEMEKSAFSGNPGVFVGAGNALLSADEQKVAFFTRVESDFTLGAPVPIYYGKEGETD